MGANKELNRVFDQVPADIEDDRFIAAWVDTALAVALDTASPDQIQANECGRGWTMRERRLAPTSPALREEGTDLLANAIRCVLGREERDTLGVGVD